MRLLSVCGCEKGTGQFAETSKSHLSQSYSQSKVGFSSFTMTQHLPLFTFTDVHEHPYDAPVQGVAPP